jgi:hypothetical protein
VALRPNTPLTSTVLGTFIIVGAALLVDVAYAYKLVPPGFVQAEPVLVYADGRLFVSCTGCSCDSNLKLL